MAFARKCSRSCRWNSRWRRRSCSPSAWKAASVDGDPMTTAVPMLEISDLHARLADGREILRGIDLSVNAGEVHAIMGPNGSGKSTLAAVLAGREGCMVGEGTVTYLGHDLLAMAAEERARARS